METQETYYYHSAWIAFGRSMGRHCFVSDHLLTDEEKIGPDYRILSGPYPTYKEGLKGKRANPNP